MKPINCKLVPYFYKTDEEMICVNKELAEKLMIKENSYCKVILGSFEASAKIVTVSEQKSEFHTLVWMTPSLFSALKVPQNISVGVTVIKRNSIKIGPVIGVLTAKRLLEKYMSGKSTREEFDFYADAGEESSSLVYIFSLSDVNRQDKSVEGYLRVRDHGGIPGWQQRRLPLPDVIHNRISFPRGSTKDQEISLLKQEMQNMMAINRITAFSKWQIAKLLQNDSQARAYIPETKLLQGPETIREMTLKHATVYLKPVRRSLGLGIIKLAKSSPEHYVASYRTDDNNESAKGKIEDLLVGLEDIMGGRLYIVQQGIDLAHINGKPFDLRVTVQKDGTGAWSLSSWGTRVGVSGSHITNVASGGQGLPIEKVLGAVFAGKYASITEEIHKVSIIICEALERGLQDIGDVGLDIGIDTGGKPYLIEVNFRDHRLTAEEMDDPDSWAKTYKKPIYYLRYLYEQQSH
ncbi:YheC/YheD family endospore coat-associated protein [Dethiobacter alkaliphilus]|uniref:YheD n=1 Tax=Dethiobacter alkaliphilus AHT 1 TaxID=555088 RepID=C0GES2_DETAL|nr:YheC/YheD family protein [Dethiobacter alkaliphilus]EEG78104.1 YheD [Dethiobacter alkaliphilus AHT 1]